MLTRLLLSDDSKKSRGAEYKVRLAEAETYLKQAEGYVPWLICVDSCQRNADARGRDERTAFPIHTSSAPMARSAPRAAVSSPWRTRRTSHTFHSSGMLWRAAHSTAHSRY